MAFVYDCGYCGIDRDPCNGEADMCRRAERGDADCARALAEHRRIKVADCRPEVLAAACEMERRLRAGEDPAVVEILARLAPA